MQFRLANTVFLLSLRTDKYNREFLQWFLPIIENNSYLHKLDTVIETTKAGLLLSDEQLHIYAKKLSASEVGGSGLKTHYAPLLGSKIGQFGSFSVELQSLFLEIHSRLAILNEEIEQYRFYFKQTFSSDISEENYKLIVNNISGSYAAVRAQAIMICDFIDRAANLDK